MVKHVQSDCLNWWKKIEQCKQTLLSHICQWLNGNKPEWFLMIWLPNDSMEYWSVLFIQPFCTRFDLHWFIQASLIFSLNPQQTNC